MKKIDRKGKGNIPNIPRKQRTKRSFNINTTTAQQKETHIRARSHGRRKSIIVRCHGI